MNRYLPGIILICCLSWGCKKDHKQGTNPTSKTYSIGYNVAFSQETAAFLGNSTSKLKVNSLVTQSTTPLSSLIDILYYKVFDSNGNIVHTISQNNTDANFGVIKDNLAAGTYTLVFVGGYSTLVGGSTYAYYPAPLNEFAAFTYDTFFKKETLVVTGNVQNQSIVMDRVVSQIVINIEDAVPAGATSLLVQIGPLHNILFYNGTFNEQGINPDYLADQESYTKTLVPGATNSESSTLAYNNSDPFSVTLTCSNGKQPSDPAYVLYAQKTIPNVTCQPNKITLLTGKLFGASSAHGSNFNITINPDWNATTINIPL